MRILYSTQESVEYDGCHYYGSPIVVAYKRYIVLGDSMSVICHCKKVNKGRSDVIADGLINFSFVRKVNTLKAILLNRHYNSKIIAEQVKQADVCIIRLPNFHGYEVVRCAKLLGKPYLTLVGGSIWDGYWNFGLRGKLIAPYAHFLMRNTQKNAPYSIYVTKEFLQKRYPTRGKSLACSDVYINENRNDVLELRNKRIESVYANNLPLTIGTAAAINVPYKGQRFVIEAMAILKKRGIIFHYHLAGPGNEKELKILADRYGISDQIFFHGQILHSAMMDFLDEIDIYCQPSLTEGLPRSIIEAMSRGCLCMGSKVGGIPELVDGEFLFRKGKVNEIVDVLSKIDREKLMNQAACNIDRSKEYEPSVLDEKRNGFLMDFKRYVDNGE